MTPTTKAMTAETVTSQASRPGSEEEEEDDDDEDEEDDKPG